MTKYNQDFVMFAGDGGLVTFQVKDGNGDPIPLGGGNVSQIEWTVQRNLDANSPIVLTKTLLAGQIAIVGDGSTGKCAITILKTDTAGLTEAYYHKLVITDATSVPATVSDGQWNVKPKPLATYSGDASTTPRDFARMLVGDTNMDAPYFPDQTYDALATKFGGPLYVAAQVCRMLAQQYSSKVSKSLGDLSIQYGQASTAFRNMAADYQSRADMSGGGMYTAGISKSDMKVYSPDFNPDTVGAFTTLNAFDNRSGSIGGFQNANTPDDSA